MIKNKTSKRLQLYLMGIVLLFLLTYILALSNERLKGALRMAISSQLSVQCVSYMESYCANKFDITIQNVVVAQNMFDIAP